MASSNIPPDMITEILYHLPVKSLGRFRCVLKGFLSLLSEPRFIKTHQNTPNRRHLILPHNLHSLHSHLFHDNELGPRRLCLHLPNVGQLTYGGSCNGLVLVSAESCGFDSDILVVLNPVTREYVELPGSDLKGNAIVHGFGYDSMTDDYKVVTISYVYKNDFVRDLLVHVYSLKTRTWRLVSDFPYRNTYDKNFSPVFVNGCLHWSAVTRSDHDSQVIVAFSLADETLNEVPLPYACNDAHFTIVPGEKLGILTKSEVWLMNEYGVRESWTKILLDELPRSYKPMVFYDNDKFLVSGWSQVEMYDIEQGNLCRPMHTYQRGQNINIVGIEPVGRMRSRMGPCHATLPRSQRVHPSPSNQGCVMVSLIFCYIVVLAISKLKSQGGQ